MSDSFFVRLQDLICFSLAIADRMSAVSSKYTRRVVLYLLLKPVACTGRVMKKPLAGEENRICGG
jgi:hypothetical protein